MTDRYRAIDEMNTRVRPERIADASAAAGVAGSFCMLVGGAMKQFPRAVDLVRRFRAKGAQVAIGGFHVSGVWRCCLRCRMTSMEAQALGVSLFAGEAEGRFETVLVEPIRAAAPALQFQGRSASHRRRAAALLPPRPSCARRGR